MPFINVSGSRTHYYHSSDYRADRSTIIFVHGAGGTGEKWIHQLSGIKGYNLIAPDLPGHGLSGGATAEAIREYREFIGLFTQALGIEKFVIVGHSMGGAIAMDFALVYPCALDALIIIDSGAKLRVNSKILEQLSRGEYPLDIVKFSYSEQTSPMVLEQAIKEMRTIPIEVFLADFRACNEFNIFDRVKHIELPALVICGLEDQMTPVIYSEYLCSVLAHSTLALIPNAGHSVMIEQPDRVNSAIGEFLSRIPTLYTYCQS